MGSAAGDGARTAEGQRLLVALVDLWKRDRREVDPPPLTRARLRESTGDALLEALAELLADGWVLEEDGVLSLTADRLPEARALSRAVHADRFGRWLVAVEDSPTNAEFFRVTNATGLVQFDMLDEVQLRAAIDALSLRPGDRAVDLGCATGALTEHVARLTGASVHGIDFAPQAIARARSRASAGVTYAIESLDDLALPAASVDAIFAFDSLYFVEDVDRVVAASVHGLAPGGRLVVFWSAAVTEDQPLARLEAGATPVGRALTALGLRWEAREFTAEELAHWRRSAAEVAQSRAAFEAEGRLDLWEGRRAEVDRVLPRCEAGRGRRWMYVAQRPPRSDRTD